MNPTIGRIVHYRLEGSRDVVWPAIVLKVLDESTVDLSVFSPSGPYFVADCKLGGSDVPRSWFWPPRAEASR